MGKKKSENKLARMSDEQKLKYLQNRAEIEEEARRRKQHLIAIYMKNKLKREDGFSRLNIAKINQEWRSILRLLTQEKLKSQIFHVGKIMHLNLERKERVIRTLICSLDEAEDIYSILKQHHANHISNMTALKIQRLAGMKTELATKLSINFPENRKSFRILEKNAFYTGEQLDCLIIGVNSTLQRQTDENNEMQTRRADDLRSKFTCRLNKMAEKCENTLAIFWTKHKLFLQSCARNIETEFLEYTEIKKREDAITTLIKLHSYKIVQSMEQISSLKSSISNLMQMHTMRSKFLQAYVKKLTENYRKKCMTEECHLNVKQQIFKHSVVSARMITLAIQQTLKGGTSLAQEWRSCKNLYFEGATALGSCELLSSIAEALKSKDDEPAITITTLTAQRWIYYILIELIDLQKEKSQLKMRWLMFQMEISRYLIASLHPQVPRLSYALKNSFTNNYTKNGEHPKHLQY